MVCQLRWLYVGCRNLQVCEQSGRAADAIVESSRVRDYFLCQAVQRFALGMVNADAKIRARLGNGD